MSAPFRDFTGIAARLSGANINTDAIIPASWMRTARGDLGRGLFGRLRYDDNGMERSDFILNREPFRRATVLIADENFGCGSSREAAVWALAQFGIKCVLAPSFADIFYENAFRNALLVARLKPEVLARVDAALVTAATPTVGIALSTSTVTTPDGVVHPFEVPPLRAQALIRGDDEIAITLGYLAEIEDFHKRMKDTAPWLHRCLASFTKIKDAPIRH